MERSEIFGLRSVDIYEHNEKMYIGLDGASYWENVSTSHIVKKCKKGKYKYIENDEGIMIEIKSLRHGVVLKNMILLFDLIEGINLTILKLGDISHYYRDTSIEFQCSKWQDNRQVFYENVIEKLEKSDFTKEKYISYIETIKTFINLLCKRCDLDFLVIHKILKSCLTPFFSDVLIDKYPSYFEDKVLFDLVNSIQPNIVNYINSGLVGNEEIQKVISNFELLMYTLFIEECVSDKVIKKLIPKIDFKRYEIYYEYISNSCNGSFFENIYIVNDEKYFKDIRDIFIF